MTILRELDIVRDTPYGEMYQKPRVKSILRRLSGYLDITERMFCANTFPRIQFRETTTDFAGFLTTVTGAVLANRPSNSRHHHRFLDTDTAPRTLAVTGRPTAHWASAHFADHPARSDHITPERENQ